MIAIPFLILGIGLLALPFLILQSSGGEPALVLMAIVVALPTWGVLLYALAHVR